MATIETTTTWSACNAHGKVTKLLLCRPEFYDSLPISEVANASIDSGDTVRRDDALKMYDEFVAALGETDIELFWETPDPAHHWQVFTRDFGTNTPVGPLIGRFKYQQRFGDEEFAAQAFDRLGVSPVGRVTTGAVEGGDCWLLDEATLVIGSGNRSTLRGIDNAREILAPHGVDVVAVEFLAKWNHLDMIFSVIGDKTALVCEEALPAPFVTLLTGRGWTLVPIPVEEVLKTGCNVLCLGDDTILSFAENGVVNAMLTSMGLRVLAPHLREFTKMGGGPHCLSFELQRARS